MRTTTYRSPERVSRSVKDSENKAVQRDTGCRRSATTHARASALLMGSIVLSLLLGGMAQGQAVPRPPRSRPDARPAPPQEATQRGAGRETTAAQPSSPDADYSLSSLLSRTTSPGDMNDADIEVNEILAQRLWQNRISAPDPNEDADTRRALRSLIQRVQSVTFDDGNSEPMFVAPLEPAIHVTNAATGAVTEAGPEQPTTTTPVPATEPLTALPPATLKQLEGLLRDPNQITDPFEMAELLFLSGRPAEAAVFYEKALASRSADDIAVSEDRAWILFQLGNCLRETDMAAARDTYMKLIAQYPNSPWTELAKAHGRLISWYQSAKPQQFMPQNE